MSFTADLIEHILNTKDLSHKDGKYNLLDCDRSELMRHMPIPTWCKNLEEVGLCWSIQRRLISYFQEGNPKEALKLAHELSMVYEQKEDKP
jgi:hypothetical protein